MRCIKRNIGHLCHDEPREQVKRPRSDNDHSTGEDEASIKHEDSPANGMPLSLEHQPPDQHILQESRLNLGQGGSVRNRRAESSRLAPPPHGAGSQEHALKTSSHQRWLSMR